ncbi:uncharacterized membrane protein YhaH (DUF805 family) [Deinococcus metalli]|uniref:Membrane protein n=1 Tax=Deinococcus metalli TaxID=1141878 RepID=A0A7W8KGH5_9DEIO|nr:DUF805 domain-containing protein [Deinococcus metalli]MBB5377353.1 uncharacterized membrane protein YhaH (DUF805 family) [Deinococcus metalli]GHF49824.1 membrane protein [Deinococcus metalli]
MNEYLNVIRNNYANFQGRARRREFWMFTLINTVILVLLQIPVQGAVLAMAAQQDSENAGLGAMTGVTLIFGVLLLIYSLAVLVPSLAVSVRRLHDTGKSGWWYLITFVPFIGSLVLLVLMVLDSEPGSNKWGPSPKGTAQAGAVSANNW